MASVTFVDNNHKFKVDEEKANNKRRWRKNWVIRKLYDSRVDKPVELNASGYYGMGKSRFTPRMFKASLGLGPIFGVEVIEKKSLGILNMDLETIAW